MGVSLEDMKVKRMPVNEQVFESMRDAIKSGTWKPGERIPSEMELSSIFGVNRLTVRMAMQRLIGMGLLDSRVGDGTYVKEFSFCDYMGRVSDFYLGPELLDKICEYRNVIEIESARLAVLRASSEEIAELEAICQNFEELKQDFLIRQEESILMDIVRQDVEFHHKICEMSHNDLFVYAFEMARELLCTYMEITLKKRVRYWNSQKQKGVPWDDLHRVVLNSIKSRDFETCKKAYADMVDYKVDL